MTLPVSIGSASHFDQGTDDPKQARAQLKQIRDDIETINNHLKLSPLISPSTPLGIGNGLEASGGNIVAKLDGSTLGLSANGLKIADDGVDLAQMAHGTAGDLLYYDASGVPTRLAKGSNDQILILAAGLPAWSDSGSQWTEISGSPFDITGSADTGTTLASVFDADDDISYRVVFEDVWNTTAGNGATLTAYLDSAEETSAVYVDSATSPGYSTNWNWGLGIGKSNGLGLNLELLVDNPGRSLGFHHIQVLGSNGSNGAAKFANWGLIASGVLNGFKLRLTIGTIDNGQCRVYKK